VGWGLAGALVASVCYGVASVLQAIGARRVEHGAGVNPRLLIRVLRSLPFLGGTGLDLLGLLCSLVALRSLPLFTAQAIVNTNLAVTAVTAVFVLHAHLHGRDKLAVLGVISGLVLLGIASGPEGSRHFHSDQRYGLLVAAVVLAAVAFILGNVYTKAHPALLGTLAGLLFGVFGIAIRVIPTVRVAHLITDPAAYAAVISSITGFLFFATALQRGSVTAATAALVVGETLIPAIVGVVILGDTARHGFVIVGVFGFLLAVGGALALARFGELPETVSDATQPDGG
jgi:drug/metabolite transporter (DMT)-like permease